MAKKNKVDTISTLKENTIAFIVMVVAAALTVGLTFILLRANASPEGTLISPLVLSIGVMLFMIGEVGATRKDYSASVVCFIFHTLVFIGVMSVAYFTGMLDGYEALISGNNHYGRYEEYSITVAASEWWALIAVYLARVVCQIVVTGIHYSRK